VTGGIGGVLSKGQIAFTRKNVNFEAGWMYFDEGERGREWDQGWGGGRPPLKKSPVRETKIKTGNGPPCRRGTFERERQFVVKSREEGGKALIGGDDEGPWREARRGKIKTVLGHGDLC